METPTRKNIMLTPPFRLMVVARSQMGKTTLMIKLMVYFWVKMFKKIYIFCPTFHKDTKWSAVNEHVKSGKIKIYNNVDSSVIKKIWSKCVATEPVLFYFDDCTGQPDFKVNNEQGVINQLVCKGNHSGISTVWVIQKFTQCSTTMRANAEGLITFYVQSEDEKKYIYKEFGIGSFKNFKTIIDESTKTAYHNFYCNRQGPGMPDYYHNFNFIITQPDGSV